MTIFVLRDNPGGLDPFGNPIEGTPRRRHFIGAYTAPRTSSDVDGRGRDGVIAGLTLFHPDPEVDLLSTDRIEVDGEMFEIEGEIGRWRSPFGIMAAGTQVSLKRGRG
jgi:hypothetical protein